jgi:His-Xaa-Ser system protein HxsD
LDNVSLGSQGWGSSQAGAGESEEAVSRVRRRGGGGSAVRLREQQAHADHSDDDHTDRDPNSDGDALVAGANHDRHPDRDGAPAPAAATTGRSTTAPNRTAAPLSRLACIPYLARIAYVALLGWPLLPLVALVALVPRLRRSPALITREVTFDADAYSVDAIQRALYKLSDRLSGDVRRSEGLYSCRLRAEATDDDAVERLVAAFQMEVLDETLRERIRVETSEVRNLILALAFSNTGLVDDESS